ncbi:MAG: outer membrane protein assembly factor BamB [Gammaproteobacteria bacterium]|nr:outer membrane protein assembly factor BamB [Gammaproteobacteria bacterium]
MSKSRTADFRTIASLLLVAALVSAGCSNKDVDPDTLPAELLKFEPELRIKKVWSAGVGDGTERLRLALRPATDGSRIYAAAHDGRVSAFTPDRGKRIWQTKTRLPLSAGPSTDGKLVVAGSNNGELIALDAETGDRRWQVDVTSEVLGAPSVGQGVVIVQTVNGKLTALDAEDGSTRWSVQQSVPRLSVRGTAGPVLARDRVISGFDNGRLACYAIEDGSVFWDVLMDPPSGRTELERLIDINSSPVVAGSDVYAAAYQGSIGAVALESGQLLWSRELSSHSGLSVDVSSLYITNQQSEIVAVSRGSGRELWRRKDIRNRDATAPAILGSSLVVGDFEGYLHWFDLRTGALQARVKAGGERISSQPLVLNETVYVLADSGALSAYRVRAD